MKKLFLFFLLVISFPFLWALDGNSITLSLTQHNGFFNYMNASNFDPENPNNQPQLFIGKVQNNTSSPIDYKLYMKMTWNSSRLFETWLPAINPISTIPLTIPNQTLLNSVGSTLFGEPSPALSLSDILDSNPDLKDAILHTGRFPDGIYHFYVQAQSTNSGPSNQTPYSNLLDINFEIRNANAIYLQRPGVQLGGMVPSISNLPLTFAWNSNLAGLLQDGFGKFTLTIREFNQVEDLQLDTVENGQLFTVIPDIDGSMYSNYISLQNGKYYAWQISTPLSNPDTSNPSSAPLLKSPWYVFKFVNEGSSQGSTSEDELVIILTNLNNSGISGLLNNGFQPTGTVWMGEKLYSGSSALQQLQSISGKTIKSITVSDE